VGRRRRRFRRRAALRRAGRTIHAGPNPKYFGLERGVTYYNLVSDQFTGLNAITVPGTLCDSLVLLSVVLEQETEFEPTEIMTDTGAYTDVIFGIFWLLGYQFSPRIADVGGARFWRVDPAGDYSPLDKLASHRAKTGIIAEHWDDLLRLAGSLKLGLVQVGGLMRTLQTNERPTRLARALEELGRIVKALYLLAYIGDEAYRRRILNQLNRGEGRHQLARVVFHGKRGELRQRYREGQEDQLGALGLVVKKRHRDGPTSICVMIAEGNQRNGWVDWSPREARSNSLRPAPGRLALVPRLTFPSLHSTVLGLFF
jgi:TnpA family transposase